MFGYETACWTFRPYRPGDGLLFLAQSYSTIFSASKFLTVLHEEINFSGSRSAKSISDYSFPLLFTDGMACSQLSARIPAFPCNGSGMRSRIIHGQEGRLHSLYHNGKPENFLGAAQCQFAMLISRQQSTRRRFREINPVTHIREILESP